MFLIILIVALVVTLICLEVRDKKNRNQLPPSEEFVDIAQLSYAEKIQKYKDDYYELSPTLRTRL